MAEKHRKRRLTRAETVELKASKLTGLGSAAPLDTTAEESGKDADTEISSQADSSLGKALQLTTLRAEMTALRKELASRSAEYKALIGSESRGESQTVARVLELLAHEEGATKAQLIEKTGARKGYVDALLNRILPERGHEIRSFPVDGHRGRAYRLVPSPHPETPTGLAFDVT